MDDAIGFSKIFHFFRGYFMADTFVRKGPETDPKELFTMKQVAAATGLSRAGKPRDTRGSGFLGSGVSRRA